MVTREIDAGGMYDASRPILLKNALMATEARVCAEGDPLERAQSDANRMGEGF
jgi:hypothetical protein